MQLILVKQRALRAPTLHGWPLVRRNSLCTHTKLGLEPVERPRSDPRPRSRGCRFRWIASRPRERGRHRRALLVVDVRAPGKAASQRKRQRQRQRRRERTPVPGAPLVAPRPQLAPDRGPRRGHSRARRARLLGPEPPARARRPARRRGPLDLRSATHAGSSAWRAATRACRRPTRFDDLLEDPELDAVLIATPVFTHFELAAASLARRQAHLRREAARGLRRRRPSSSLELAATRACVLMCGHTFTLQPAGPRGEGAARRAASSASSSSSPRAA